jgi:menaquinone-9 beta-reductase
MGIYDVITVGGGLAGSALGRALAERGLNVLILEREKAFRDRVRGEQMHPWGVAEARALGVYELLIDTCGHELPFWDVTLGSERMPRRDLTMTTPQQAPELSFYHPEMQRVVLQAAEDAGAEVRRGARVREIKPGAPPSVTVADEAGAEEIRARLVVGADGRGSIARQSAGFEVERDAPGRLIAGLLLDECRAAEDTSHAVLNPALGRASVLFPQGGGRARTYLIVQGGERFQGEDDVPRFVEESVRSGARPEHFEGARTAGPLATFEAADSWVEHPYRGGVALVGDAASANDPSFGEGLSLTVRDVRVLRDRLLETDDWESAAHAYAAEHDRHYGIIHEVTRWFAALFLEQGPEADARRARALPLMGQDPMRMPDHLFSGPDLPFHETMRARLFGED